MLRQQGKKEEGAAKRRRPSICDCSGAYIDVFDINCKLGAFGAGLRSTHRCRIERDRGGVGDVEALHLRRDRQPCEHVAMRLGILPHRSAEHTSELQLLMRSEYAVFCMQQKSTRSNEQKGKRLKY